MSAASYRGAAATLRPEEDVYPPAVNGILNLKPGFQLLRIQHFTSWNTSL